MPPVFLCLLHLFDFVLYDFTQKYLSMHCEIFVHGCAFGDWIKIRGMRLEVRLEKGILIDNFDLFLFTICSDNITFCICICLVLRRSIIDIV